jgi:hypothetical protein
MDRLPLSRLNRVEAADMYPYSATTAQLHLVNKGQPDTESLFSISCGRFVAVDLFTMLQLLVCSLKAQHCLGIRVG